MPSFGSTDHRSPKDQEGGKKDEHHGADKVKHPFSGLRQKLKDSHLYDLKVQATHLKHKVGKAQNLVNTNHRHDEEHEKETDDKRIRIGESHRFQSFAPERDGVACKWYVDGRDYFWAVSIALEQAKEIVYIADWWLSPELFLRRPPAKNHEWRLDQVLKRAAERGVEIYLIVYKEVTQALTCNSAHTKRALQALCPEGSPGHGKIHVMRHPDHNFFEGGADMTFYWAHHEKFIVIDYDLAFIGGLDNCFGRWDTRQHQLADVHPAGAENEIWPGQDYNNNRIMDFNKVEDWMNQPVSKTDYGRMPWHDVSMGIVGPAVYDIAEHFVLRWNFCKRDKYKREDKYPWIELEGRLNEDEDLVGVQRPKHPVGGYLRHPPTPLGEKRGRPAADNIQGSVRAQIVRSSADWSSGILTEHSIQNAYCELIRNAQHFVYIENQFFITATGDQQAPIQNQIGGAIVDAVIRAAKEGRKFRVIVIIPAIPGFAGDLREDAATGTRAIMDYQYRSINRGEHSIFGQIKKAGFDPHNYVHFFNLRSYDRLNKTPALMRQEEIAGVKYEEVTRAQAEEVMPGGNKAIQKDKTEKDMDTNAETTQKDTSQELKEKRQRFEDAAGEAGLASESGETQVKSADSVAKDAMLGEGKVSDEAWDDDDFEQETEVWFSEILYPHSKILIVDDKTVICGSSNLNDRSQLGFHDSELSIVMQDTNKLPSKMDGQDYEAGHHAATLRRFLWREHLGLLPAQTLDGQDDPNCQPPGVANAWHDGDEWDSFVADPMSDELWKMWTERATTNTTIFRWLFHSDPDDHIKTFEDYQNFLPRGEQKTGHLFNAFTPAEHVRQGLDKIKGHLVNMPLDFLCNAQMAERGMQVNSITESIYT